MPLISAGKCDIGQKRKTNQDSIYIGPEKNLFVVADGMGGHNGGDIASAMAVEEVPNYFTKNSNEDAIELCRNSIVAANTAIKNRGEQDSELVGMGTTIVGLFFKEQNVYIPNCGDSRAYLINNNELYQLSKDHSLVQEKLTLGLYTREEAKADPQKNVLVKTVGFEELVQSDVFVYKVSKNDMFMICSDGLHGKVCDEDIISLINEYIPNPQNATQEDVQNVVDKLVQQANDNGGQDNISVIIVIAK